MEKVKVTQEQADAIDLRKRINRIEHSIKIQLEKDWAGDTNKSLNKLSLDEFIRALYIGYEVEPQFEAGDWVFRTNGKFHRNYREGKVFKVKDIIEIKGMDEYKAIDNDDESEHLFRNIRHATPDEIAEEKQRRWWKKHNRDVWDLKIGDLLVNKNKLADMFEFQSYDNYSNLYGYSLVTDCHEVLGRNEAKEKFEIACFAEDRKDI